MTPADTDVRIRNIEQQMSWALDRLAALVATTDQTLHLLARLIGEREAVRSLEAVGL